MYSQQSHMQVELHQNLLCWVEVALRLASQPKNQKIIGPHPEVLAPQEVLA